MIRHTIIYYLGKILNFFTFDFKNFWKNKKKNFKCEKSNKIPCEHFDGTTKKKYRNIKVLRTQKFYPPPPLVGFTRLIKSIELLLADRPSSTTRYYTNPTILTRGNPYDRQRVIATYSHGLQIAPHETSQNKKNKKNIKVG